MSFQELFKKSNGQSITYEGKEIKMVDKVSLPYKETMIDVRFISTNSDWEQGLILQTKGEFIVNEQKIKDKIVLWEHTAPELTQVITKSKDYTLIVYNVWKTHDGTIHYWNNGGALYSTETNDKVITYHCNDGHNDDDFDNLIFELRYSEY